MSLKDRFSRQTFVRIVFALNIIPFLFSPSCMANTNTAKHGGQVVFATISDPKTFNSIIAKDAGSSAIVGRIFDGLTRTNVYNGKVEPLLAESWVVSEDGLTWVFSLRKDVLWNDGVPFTADDVVFTYNDLIYNEEIPTSSRDSFTLDGQIIKVEKLDTHTVQFTLPLKFAPFLRALAQEILPKHKLKPAVDNKTFNFTWTTNTPLSEIVGTGPYKLHKYDPGQRIILIKNEHYWKKGSNGDQLPYLEKLVYMIVQNSDVAVLKFLDGSVDALALRGSDYPLIKPLEEGGDFTIYNLGPDTGSQFIFFNQNSREDKETGKPYVDPKKLKWFTDIHFRRAVAHAIDKEQIIAIVKNGLGFKQHSSVGPGAGFFHNPNVKKYEYSLQKAKDILNQAGYVDRNGDGYVEDKEGHMLEFNLATNGGNTDRLDISGIIRHDLEKIGMKVNFQLLEFNTLVQKIDATYEWDAIILGLTGGIEPHFGKNVWTSIGQLHMWNPKQETPATKWEERVDEIFNQGVQELDEDKRKVYYDEFQMIVSENLPLIYTVLGAQITAVRDRIGNLKPTNLGGAFHNMEELYIKK